MLNLQIYCRQLGLLGKANFNGCTDPAAKELDSWLPHHFSTAGVPTNADECLEAVQSNLTGHSACFLMVYGICSTCKLFQLDPNNFVPKMSIQ